jgi:hypothetical protein
MRATQLDNRSTTLRRVAGWLMPLLIALPQAVFSAQDTSSCGHSTVEDAWGAEVASQARSFLTRLQRIVRSDDKAQFASVTHYPVRVLDGSRVTEISSPSDLVRNYSSVLTPDVRHSILAQSATCLFANGQGMMIGKGQVWFRKEPSGDMKIITINLSAPRGGDR